MNTLVKSILCLLPFFFSIQIYGQTTQDSLLDRKLDSLVNKYKTGKASSAEIKQIKNINYQIQNGGFGLFERSRDYDNSLRYINRALNVWIQLRDTANQANLHKFKGVLLAHLLKTDEAKGEVGKAIELYQSKQIAFGIAVSQFDFSKVYELNNQYDSAFYFANQSLHFWKPKSDTFRIITINLQLMNLYLKTNNPGAAEKIQKDTKSLIGNKTYSNVVMLDYYYLSGKTYETLKRQQDSDSYYKLYKSKFLAIESKEGYSLKSEYD